MIHNKKRILVASVLVLLLTLLSIVRSTCGGRPKRNYAASEMLGKVMAEEACKLLANKGTLIVLAGEEGAQRVQLQALKANLKKKQGIKIVTVKNLTTQEIGQSAMWGQVPWAIFLDVLQQHRGVTAVLSLIGPPRITDAEMASVPPNLPKFLVFAPMGIGVKDLLAEGIIQIAIVHRTAMMASVPRKPVAADSDAPASKSAPGSAEESYQILTSESDLSRFVEPVPPPLPARKP